MVRQSLVVLLWSGIALGAEITPLFKDNKDPTLNQQLLAKRTQQSQPIEKDNRRDIVVFIGDRVIPQFVDGAGWQTTITVINLENRLASFHVLFFNDNGTDLIVPVVGQGPVRGMNITLGVAESFTFETAGTASQLAQGWALISQSTNDSIGALTVFRQRVFGRPDQEAVVPTVNQFSSHFVLLFDNTAFVTAVAIANPTLSAVVIPVSIRNEAGQIIDRRTISLGPFSHTAFALPAVWGSTAGRRGAVEFLTSGFGVGALGLRFSGSAFTSFHVLENFNWR